MADDGDEGVVEPVDAGDFDDFADPAEPGDARPPTPGPDGQEWDDDAEEASEVAGVNVTGPVRTGADLRRNRTREILVCDPEDHMTPDFLSPVEVATVVATRAAEIPRTGDVFLPKGVQQRSDDPVDLAIQELESGCCPLTVRRERSHQPGVSIIEVRRVRDLLLLDVPNLSRN